MRRPYILYLLAGVCVVYLVGCWWIMHLLAGTKDGITWMGYLHLNATRMDDSSCPIIDLSRFQRFVTSTDDSRWRHMSADTCPAADASTDIQMEKEWDQIPVHYPNYVLSVSGWIQVVKVNSWKVKPLEVIIVPHSHQDPGWLQTFDQYYKWYTASTLDIMVDRLTDHPDWTFIWSDVIWLARWWTEASADRKLKFHRVLSSGQLEIVTGGWVMSDEGTAHYAAMLGQLTEGHQWLKDNLGITPNISWAVDPFGHSATMTYLLQRSNVPTMVIQRVSYAVKMHLASQRRLEFHWTQAWDHSGTTSSLCHMMPFLSYAIPFSCGPDPHVCCKFDFIYGKCYQGHEKIPPINVTDDNVAYLAKLLWEQFQKKAELYQGGVILVPMGDDFYYSKAKAWDTQFVPVTKLMDYINNADYMNTKVRFGTLRDYFTTLLHRTSEEGREPSLPTLAGDFLTYTDRADQYWSGYYTSRPHYKHVARKLQSILRSVEILFSLCLAQAVHAGTARHIMDTLMEATKLQTYRQTLALFQHHDAITGTSKRSVVRDYGIRLHDVFVGLSAMLCRLLKRKLGEKHKYGQFELDLNTNWSSYDQLMMKTPIVFDGSQNLVENDIVLYNSLPHTRREIVSLHVTRSNVKVKDRTTGQYQLCQISPVWSSSGMMKRNTYELVFEVELPALSVRTYALLISDKSPSMAQLSVPKPQIKDFSDEEDLEFDLSAVKEPLFTIENTHLFATFATCTGALQYVTRKSDGHTLRSEVKFMTYGTGSKFNPFQDKSGAYTFQPDGKAKPLLSMDVKVYVVEGPLLSRVITVQSGIIHSITLYNSSAGVYVDNVVDLSSGRWNNTELVLRLDTDVVDTNNRLCVDLNGFQMHRKKTRQKLKIQGNFYPMTTMAAIETSEERLSLLASETHGVASLSPGQLEVVLDRRLLQGDWRGLNEGVTDNVPTRSQFILLFERRHNKHVEDSLMCYPSPLALTLSDLLEHPLHILTVSKQPSQPGAVQPVRLGLDLPFPALSRDMHVVALRSLYMVGANQTQALLVLQRRVADCGFMCLDWQCDTQTAGYVDMTTKYKSVSIKSVEETILTGVKIIGKVKDKKLYVPAMEMKAYKISYR